VATGARSFEPPPVGLHRLRHSAASRLRQGGCDAAAISRTLGHRSVSFALNTYVHLFESDLEEVQAAMDFPEFSPAGVVFVSDSARAPGPVFHERFRLETELVCRDRLLAT